MKRALAALVAVAIMIVAIPATAEAAFHQRWVGTRCYTGKVLVEKIIDGTQIVSNYSCPSYTGWYGKYFTWHRPELDIHVADDYARRWWGHCRVEWSGVDAKHYSSGNNASWYFVRFNLYCP